MFVAPDIAMSDDLPFKAEYAKSGRAACKACKANISKDSLRVAKMVQVGEQFNLLPDFTWNSTELSCDSFCVLMTLYSHPTLTARYVIMHDAHNALLDCKLEWGMLFSFTQ